MTKAADLSALGSNATTAGNLSSASSLSLQTNSTEQMRITSTGGISFGSSGTAYGTTGQALQSNGNTTPTWGTLSVSGGGTGFFTTTANGILAGGATPTGNFQNVGTGTTGQVLTSNGTGLLPTFQAASGFPTGTIMLFGQTAAPTGWTKDTVNFDNSALRVVTGSASSGGTQNFTTAFASQTPTGSVSITSVAGSAGATTLTTPQIPSHAHDARGTGPVGGAPGTSWNAFVGSQANIGPYSVNATGGGGSHTHPFSFSSGSGTFTGNAINLAVKYVDIIRATKD
jgi:hypothetical protein